jgi:hypothetical protein
MLPARDGHLVPQERLTRARRSCVLNFSPSPTNKIALQTRTSLIAILVIHSVPNGQLLQQPSSNSRSPDMERLA